MKIALLSTFIHPIVEPFMGGTEAFLARFATALSRQGVEVVCYACEGSEIPGVEIRTLGVARGVLVFPRALDELSGEETLAIRAYEDAVMYQAIEDVCNDPSISAFHNHSFSAIPFFLAHRLPIPVLHTLHLPPILPNMVEALRFCRNQNISLHAIAVSESQRQVWQPYYPVSQVIYNGLAIEDLPLGASHEGRLAFVGRIDPTKGVEDAIAVASVLKVPLDIYGPVQPANLSYFEEVVQPLIQQNPLISYHGAVPQATLFQALSTARALLFPVKWDEPFGNVIIEAMAVGTPVVMYDRGSARELITEGVNGAIVPPDDIAAMVAAVEWTATLDRVDCATSARTRFSMTSCVENYLALLRSVSGVTAYSD
jgi:glycosyltransferase involved in cell wall biosynthesis